MSNQACRVNECFNPIRNKKQGLCNRHYLRQMRHGDVHYKRIYEYQKECMVQDCYNLRCAKGYCSKHYDRLRTKGDVNKTAFHVEKHGMVKHELYSTWNNMKSRCYRSESSSYNAYGGRGISMCDKWRYSFSSFVNDVGERPSRNHTLDRIDNDGNYEPSNVRWATQSQQTLNTRIRIDNKYGYKGICKSHWKKYRVYTGGGPTRVEWGHYDTLDEALSARLSAECLR